MKKEIILKGKGFTIRPYRKDDYISLAKNANNKKIAKNLLNGFPSPYTEKNAKEWIKMNINKYKEGFYYNFVIDVGGLAVGTIGAGLVEEKPFIMSFGYWLGENYWNKGIVSEAARLYLKYAFKTFRGVERIQAITYLWNKGSQRVLQKNGFKMEGILRKSYLKDGKIIDKYIFSKLRNDR